MANEVATTTQNHKAAVDQFRGDLTKLRNEIVAVLPKHVTIERFNRVVLTAVQQSKDLIFCTPKSILASCLQCAKDGLIPDGREAALVKFGDTCQYMPMVNGLIKLARQSGEISTITAQIVYEKDVFDIDLASDQRPVHKPFLDGDRGQFRIAYALATFKDGTHQLEVMTLGQIEKIRAISRAKNNGPWVQHWDEMARKTVLRRLMKYLSLSPELARAIEADDATYDVSLQREQARASLPASINDDVPQIEHVQDDGTLDGETDLAEEAMPPSKIIADMISDAETFEALDLALEQIKSTELSDGMREALTSLYNDKADALAEQAA